MWYIIVYVFFSSRRLHTRCALVTGVQTCALPICPTSCASASSPKPAAPPGWRAGGICRKRQRAKRMAELLLELLSEEIPARMQGRAAEDQSGRASCWERGCPYG